MKPLKRILSMMLVVCMIFTSQAFVTFAEGMENTEAIVNETELVGASDLVGASSASAETETTVGESEDLVGASLASAETETELTESEEGSHSSPVQGEKEPEETTVGASDPVGASSASAETDPETEYAEEPEEDEIETKVETETEVEETTVSESDLVGASSASAEEESEETVGASDLVGASSASAEEETTVGAKLGEPETEVKTESEAEPEVEEKLFGDPPIYTLSLEPNFPEGFSLPEGKSWYEDKSGPLYSDTDSILIEGWNDRICVDTAGNVCNLTGYNTKADGSGIRFSYQESISKENLEYFNLPSGSYDLVLYAMWRTSNLYTLHYNQNLPEGYSLAEGSTWGNDATLWDYVDEFVFEIYDYTGMTCEDASGNVRTLEGWNTAAGGTGDDYSFGDWITSESLFTDGELTLYAVWSEPVGPGSKNFYVLYYADDANYSTWTLSEKHISASADATAKEAFANDLFNNCIYNLSAAEPRGFYKIGDGSTEFDIDVARRTYNRWSEATIELEKDKLLEEYESWVNDGAEHDVYYGTLINTYFYLLHYDSDGNPAFIQVKCTDTEDTVNAYLATIKGSAPSGKKFKTWQYWHADWYEEEGYDYSDDGEKEFYKNLVENPSNFETDADVIETFNAWTPEPYENRHYGAIYEDSPFMYWKIDGDDANKTIHYYATPGEGRTAVTIGTDGIEYTGLETSEKEKIKKAVIEEPIVATDVRKLFSYFKGLVSITNLGNLDTSNATSFKAMFERCEAIEKIETSGLETDSLTDTSYMFTYCLSATEIILDDDFDTSNVTSMREMFNTTGVKELDLTNFDTSNVTDMYGMFSSCENLETIRVSDKFVVDKVSTSNGKFMFASCDNLKGGQGTTLASVGNVTDKTYAKIDEGSTNPGLFSGAPTPTTTYTVKYNQDLPTGYTLSGGMTWYTDSTTTDLTGNPIILKGSADMTCEDTSGNTRTLQSWNTQIEHKGNTFNFGAEFKDSQYFDPDPTCTLYAMWSDPVPPAPTPVTTDWYWYLDGTHMHYTATAGDGRTKVTFNGDLGVDYGSTDVTTVTEVTIDDKISPENLHGLFRRFTSLTKINSFTNLDTSNCTDMARMFQGCSSLESINVSHFNTSKVKDMSRVFNICEKLKSIDVSNFDTQNAEKMYQMFGTCLVITDIKFSSKFVTNKVTEMYQMFSRCEKIASLDISSFDVSSVTNANDMFASCHELVTIKTSPTLDFSSVGKGNSMFSYCFKIKGGEGTTYDENHVDKSYAHVDGGTSNPGYFTGGSAPTPGKKVSSFVVKANPSKTTYLSGDAFDPTGLVITVTYDDSTKADIDYDSHKSDFSFDPTTITASGDVVVTYGGKTATVAVIVNKPKPTPTPTPPGGGGTGGSSSGDSNPEKGPMGDLTKNPMYQQQLQNQQLNTTNNIPQTSLLTDTTLISTLQSYSQNQYMPKTNARDQYGNTGFGQWQHVPGTQTWYFLSGDLNSNGTTGTVGLLTNGWYNLGWDGQDKWYHFDANGVMGLGWYQEGGKTYYLETNPYDNWYGKAVTGQQIIDGQVYNFDASGALIA